jgi:hypothetical protein
MRSLMICTPHPIHFSGDKIRRMRWAEHVARMRKGRGVYRVLMEKPGGKRPLGRRRRRWEDIKLDLQEVGGGDMECIELAGTCECSNEPSGSLKYGEFRGWLKTG